MPGGSDTPAQRTRTKTPDFSDLFRSAHGSRHASRTGAGIGSSSSSSPWQADKADKVAVTKAPSRRSMLPFLGRKKTAEQSAVPVPSLSRKSVSNVVHQTTVNTVRRSFGNGHAVLMITPSPHGLHPEPPLPSKHLPVDTHSLSLGSKLAAHFTPLRTPTRNSKARHSMMHQPDASVPPVPSSALSPLVPEIRAPSVESHSSIRSRSTTPRPLRGPPLAAAVHGDEEDFSDLFTLPEQLKKPQQSPQTPSSPSVQIYLGDSPKKSGELTPTTPITPSGPPLHFPIPPSSAIPRSILSEKGFPGYSIERPSLSSSQGSRSPSKHRSPSAVESSSPQSLHDASSHDERQSHHRHTTSASGSDTDTSRANESTYSASSFRLSPVVPKVPSRRPKLSVSSLTKTSSGPPPTVPLPSPPLSPNPASLFPRSAPSTPPNRVAFPRPRANTLSVTSNLVVPGDAVTKSSQSSLPNVIKAIPTNSPDVTIDELQEALSQQRRKNAQLQEYIGTITKRYEDDRVAMARTIEKLERNIRKKTREIEGLRWLVIHHGAVSDIDAATNLARSSLSTQEGDGLDRIRRRSPSSSSPVTPLHQSTLGQKDPGVTMAATASAPEFRPESSTASFSTSVSDTSSLTTPSLSVIPERIDAISRSERKRMKEERRASKALRRLSAVSTLALGTEPLVRSPSRDGPVDPNFDPKRSMDEVMEKLQPFRHS